MKPARWLFPPLILGMSLFWGTMVRGAEWSSSSAAVPRTSNADGVRIVVTPKAVEAGAAAWDFQVVMDTHIKPLSEDPAQIAVLIDDKGRRYKALDWQGDPPGAHHREGILRFPLPAERPKAVELQLTGIGGPEKRVLRWEIN